MVQKEEKLMKDTILYTIANFGSSALSFLMLPLYTYYFTTEEFGLWDLSFTSVTLLVPLVTLELTNATYRWLLDAKQQAEKSTIISTGFFQTLLQMLFLDSIAIILFMFLEIPYKWHLLFLINVLIISGFLQQCARGLSRNKLFASLGLLQAAIVVLLNLVFILYYHLRVEAFFYAYSMAALIVIGVAWVRLDFSTYLTYSKRSATIRKAFFQYAIPIIPAAASWWVMTMADRWIIAIFLGISANGIYAIAIKIPAILLMINTVFSLAWKDSAILNFATENQNRYYSDVFTHYFRFMSSAVILLILLAKPLLAIFIDPAYFEAWKYSGILLLAALFNAFSLFWSAGFHGAKQTKTLLNTTIVGAGLNVICNLALVPFIGLYGIAISTFFAFLVTWILRVRGAKAYFNIKLNIKDISMLSVFTPIAITIPFLVNKIGIALSIVMAVLLLIRFNWEFIDRMRIKLNKLKTG